MTAKIQNEMRNIVGSSDIMAKIFEAINAYRHESFYFNQGTSTFSTVIGQREYPFGSGGVPTDILKIESMTVLYGSRPIVVKPVDPIVIFEDSAIYTPTIPTSYGIHHQSILFYPTPGSIYSTSILYIKDINTFDETSPGSSTNAWFSDGERLIRNFTKALLYGEIARNAAEESRAIGLATRAYLDLKRQSSMKTSDWQPVGWEI